MKRNALVLAVALVCVSSLMVRADETITGQKFQLFNASPERYLEQPVALEDTFGKIVDPFSRIEIQNYLTPDRYLKFKLGQCPYPCIAPRSPSLEDALGGCMRGELIRITGNLQKVYEKRTMETVRGKYTGGRSWEERVYVYGPLQSEYYFNVIKIEKGWGRQDSPEDMFAEGKNLAEEHYQQVSPEAITGEPEKLVERSIWFEGAYGGFDENFSEGEKAAGLTPEKVIKFAVKGMQMPCYVSKSESNAEGFKSVPLGAKVQIYGRIRVKETPKGLRSAFFVDRVTRTVSKEEVATPAPKTGN
ncbi:MAG: hypothetical protein NTX71_08130 [Candidatus Aureabacteria bacterium]|nr:hypothetical protein [Candidatus Auribacterota bacterium]